MRICQQKKIYTDMCILLLFILKVIPDMKFAIACPADYCTEVDFILFRKHLNLDV